MKKFLLILLILLAAAAAYIYIYPRHTPGFLKGTPVAPKAESTVLYKWQDEQGNWTVSGEPPPEGTHYQATEYRHDVNVVPHFPAPGEGE